MTLNLSENILKIDIELSLGLRYLNNIVAVTWSFKYFRGNVSKNISKGYYVLPVKIFRNYFCFNIFDNFPVRHICGWSCWSGESSLLLIISIRSGVSRPSPCRLHLKASTLVTKAALEIAGLVTE